MIGVIHKHGTSFKGLGRYLFHDIEADTDERVAWVETHNIATEDQDAAVRVMIATAMQQDELKREAGVPATGRKSKSTVMHYSLSWHHEEDEKLTREEMLLAARASLTYLGTDEGEVLGKNKKTGQEIKAVRTQHADEHQAVIVCHREEGKAPHVHVMLNRVHPEHGVMLPDTNDYKRLSAWALDYRQAQGKEHYCPQRVKNAAMQAQGYVTSCRRKSRKLYELEQARAAARENEKKVAELDRIRKRTAELAAKRESLQEQEKQAVHAIEDQLIQDTQTERDRTAAAIRAERSRIAGLFKPRMEELTDRQAAERQAFDDAQETMRGRVGKTWEVFNTRQWMTEIRQSPIQAMKDAFGLAFSSGMQRQQLERYHEDEQARLIRERQRREAEEAARCKEEMRRQTEERQRRFQEERSSLMLTLQMEAAKHTAEWAELHKARDAALGGQPVLPTFTREAAQDRTREITPPFNQASGSHQGEQTQSGDEGGLTAEDRARMQEWVDQHGDGLDRGQDQGLDQEQ